MRLWHLVLTGLFAGANALAAVDPQHTRIDAERAAANARYAEQERACRQKFVVAPCLDEARKEQQAELARLRRERIQLDDAQRREAAAARLRELDSKARLQAARGSAAAASTAERAPRSPRPPHPPAASQPNAADALHRPAAAGDAARRSADEQRNEQKFEARQRAAQAHREEVERRNAERAARGKIAAPLPSPPPASGLQ